MDQLGDPEDPDAPFPSGEWTGFHRAAGVARRQDLHLTFACGELAGIGIDSEGEFVVEGSYDRESMVVTMTKTYPGRRDVHYQGYREALGIWGISRPTAAASVPIGDGFHIWPRSEEHAVTGGTAAALASAVDTGLPSWLFRI